MATAFFFNQSGAGHVNPTLGLVAELARRGETVVYYAHEPERARIQAAGAEFRPYADSGLAPQQIEGHEHLALLKLREALALLPKAKKRISNAMAQAMPINYGYTQTVVFSTICHR